jgi:putative intracellular protease/amidase
VHLILMVLLGLAAIGRGQEPQTRGQRRTPRANLPRTIQLPESSNSTGVSVAQALIRTQSVTVPSDQRLQPDQIGQLLWAGQGVVMARPGGGTPDQLPAIRVYVVLPDGLYLYNPSAHTLQQTVEGDLRGVLAAAVLNREGGPVGGCQIILAGMPREFATRLGNRSRNVMLLEAGQMAQSIQLEAVSRDLTFIMASNFDASSARRTCRLPRDVEPLCVLLVGLPVAATPELVRPQTLQGPPRRVVLVVPQTGFQDEELFATKRGLELASVQTVIASTKLGAITGSAGGVAEAELLINRISLDGFDAIVFIGGPGTATLVNNRLVLDLARLAAAANKVIAASGNAPGLLASAGIVSGARVTALLAERDKLLAAGAIYTGTTVEKDGRLVTSAGPQVVPQFVMAITDALAGR